MELTKFMSINFANWLSISKSKYTVYKIMIYEKLTIFHIEFIKECMLQNLHTIILKCLQKSLRNYLQTKAYFSIYF